MHQKNQVNLKKISLILCGYLLDHYLSIIDSDSPTGNDASPGSIRPQFDCST